MSVGRFCSLSVALTLLTLAACSGASPEVGSVELRVASVRNPEDESVHESLRFFVAANDPDGPDDLAIVFLIHYEAEIYWEFPREDWTEVQYGGQPWYGAERLSGELVGGIPRGRYRVIVEDLAGTRSESEAFLTSAERPAATEFPEEGEFPALEGVRGSWRIEHDRPVVLRVYDRAGELVVNQVVAPGPLSPEIRGAIPDETGLQVYLETIEEPRLRISGPYRF